MSADVNVRCYQCKLTDGIDTCPMCGKTVCLVCAEREGAFCCDEEEPTDPLPRPLEDR